MLLYLFLKIKKNWKHPFAVVGGKKDGICPQFQKLWSSLNWLNNESTKVDCCVFWWETLDSSGFLSDLFLWKNF